MIFPDPKLVPPNVATAPFGLLLLFEPAPVYGKFDLLTPDIGPYALEFIIFEEFATLPPSLMGLLIPNISLNFFSDMPNSFDNFKSSVTGSLEYAHFF